MLRIRFTADDFASTRFLTEPAPGLEMKFAARGLWHGIRTPWGERWRCAALGALPGSPGPIRGLTSHFTWELVPAPALLCDLDEGVEAIMRMSPRRARAELRLFRNGPSTGIPATLRFAIAGDRDAAGVLTGMMHTMFTAAVAPYMADVRANHRSELARQGRLLASRGLAAALTEVIPGSSWCDNWLRIDSPQEQVVELGGRGLQVTPAAFWTGPPLIGDRPGEPVLLAYPAPATLNIRVGTESDTLAAILGVTRAAVLRLLAVEHTTGDIARELDISAGSASGHATALREAGLIGSRREGKAVVHGLSVLGADLIGANTR